jgi:hypothetical protein
VVDAVVVWAIVGLLLTLIYTKLSRHALDPLALFCYGFFFFYVFRESVITLGLDPPYPDNLFIPAQTPHVLTTAGLCLLCFLGGVIAGYIVSERAVSVFALVPVTRKIPSIKRQTRLVVVLTAAATVITAYLLHRFHGVAGVVRAGKLNGSLAGSYELRIFPAIGAVTAASLAVTVWRDRRKSGPRRNSQLLGIAAAGAALLNSAYVLLWGSRQAAAIVLLIFLAGIFLLERQDRRAGNAGASARRRRTSFGRLVLVGVVLALCITGLRIARDTVLVSNPSGTSAIQGQSPLRSVSVATDSTYFDAVLLAVRDWPGTYAYRGGEDFGVGVEALVPRVLWPGKPADVRPGAWFRALYQPQSLNGWPLGAVGDWYLGFGFPGLLFGGLLSGLVLGVLMNAWRTAPWTPFNLASIMCMVAFVIPTGVEALSLLHWAQWGLPLLLCARYLDATPKPSFARPANARRPARVYR